MTESWLFKKISSFPNVDAEAYSEHIESIFVHIEEEDERREALEDFLSEIIPKDDVETTLEEIIQNQKELSLTEDPRAKRKKEPDPKNNLDSKKKDDNLNLNSNSKSNNSENKSQKKNPSKNKSIPLNQVQWTKKELELIEPQQNSMDDTMYLSENDEIITPLQLLCLIFPSRSQEFLEDQYEQSNRNLDDTVSRVILLIQKEEEERQQALEFFFTQPSKKVQSQNEKDLAEEILESNEVKIKNKNICRHFLEGLCIRADCWYSHDVSSITCRYWVLGTCLKGDKCGFFHGFEKSEEDNQDHQSSEQIQEKNFIMDQQDFPQLIQKSSQKKKSTSQQENMNIPTISQHKKTGEMDFANTAKLAKLIKDFPWVDQLIIKEIFQGSGSKETETRQKLLSMFPCPEKFQQSSNLNPTKNQIISETPEKLGTKKSPIVWVETGMSLTQEYFKLREEAIEHAVLRNKFFQRATESYLKGDRANAKYYSTQGRYHDQRMIELHEQASEEMFLRRNQNLSAHDQKVIDLHGLHVDEASKKMIQKVRELKNEKYIGSLCVITGTGHHSYDYSKRVNPNEGKLSPAIRGLLKDLGFTPFDISPDKRGGMLLIQFQE